MVAKWLMKKGLPTCYFICSFNFWLKGLNQRMSFHCLAPGFSHVFPQNTKFFIQPHPLHPHKIVQHFCGSAFSSSVYIILWYEHLRHFPLLIFLKKAKQLHGDYVTYSLMWWSYDIPSWRDFTYTLTAFWHAALMHKKKLSIAENFQSSATFQLNVAARVRLYVFLRLWWHFGRHWSGTDLTVPL